MSVWHMQPDIAASRRQHKQLYQVQGRYLRYVGLVALACVLYYVWFFLQFGISGEQLTTGLQQIGRYLARMFVWHDFWNWPFGYYFTQIGVTLAIVFAGTLTATVLILLCIPATLFIGCYYGGTQNYYLLSVLVMLECMLPFFMVFEGRRPQARELVVIAVLCALGVAGRAAFFMLPQFKPVMALTIIAGVAFGGETGFLVGAMTMLASNFLFSQGPWTPFQMFSMGIIGFLAGVLFRKGWLRRSRGALCVYGVIAAVVIYGGIMNPASALMYSQEVRWKVLVTYYITGFPMDCVHAAATVLFLLVLAEPMLEKLDRIKVKYGLVE